MKGVLHIAAIKLGRIFFGENFRFFTDFFVFISIRNRAFSGVQRDDDKKCVRIQNCKNKQPWVFTGTFFTAFLTAGMLDGLLNETLIHIITLTEIVLIANSASESKIFLSLSYNILCFTRFNLSVCKYRS